VPLEGVVTGGKNVEFYEEKQMLVNTKVGVRGKKFTVWWYGIRLQGMV
jgi:hypothetical protein